MGCMLLRSCSGMFMCRSTQLPQLSPCHLSLCAHCSGHASAHNHGLLCCVLFLNMCTCLLLCAAALALCCPLLSACRACHQTGGQPAKTACTTCTGHSHMQTPHSHHSPQPALPAWLLLMLRTVWMNWHRSNRGPAARAGTSSQHLPPRLQQGLQAHHQQPQPHHQMRRQPTPVAWGTPPVIHYLISSLHFGPVTPRPTQGRPQRQMAWAGVPCWIPLQPPPPPQLLPPPLLHLPILPQITHRKTMATTRSS